MTHLFNPDLIAATAMRLLGPEPANWVPDRPGVEHNVVLVGGGQTGLALSFALRRAGIGRVSVIDAAPEAASAGAWPAVAGTDRLRTPKDLTGPDLGIPGIGFQAWYESRRGKSAFESLDRIPRLAWADYLNWYRRFLKIPVRYGTRLLRIEPADGCLRLHLDVGGRQVTETARKVALGTGFAGGGAPHVPPALSGLPRAFLSHTHDGIDFDALRGKAVAIVGAAAAAFDAACAALESGAAAVHMFARRAAIASVPVAQARGYPGAYDNYRQLPDAVRWRQAVRSREAGSGPAVDAIRRAAAASRFRLHLAAPWQRACVDNGLVVADAADGTFRFDHVIAATGYSADPAHRPELAGFADRILLWRDQYAAPADEEDAFLGSHPYLGEGYEYMEKTLGEAPFLRNIHVHNPAGLVSFGLPTGGIAGLRRDVPAVTARISRDLFLDDLPVHQQLMSGAVAPAFSEAVYASAVWTPGG
jgi:cation diffusion facilitator CzcD-associated flavoprotein CzcO